LRLLIHDSFGHDLRVLAITCVQFDRVQVYAQVNAGFHRLATQRKLRKLVSALLSSVYGHAVSKVVSFNQPLSRREIYHHSTSTERFDFKPSFATR